MMRKSSARPLASYLSPSSSVAPIHGPAARREVGGHGPAYLEPEEEGVRARPVTTSRPVHCRASKRTGRHGLSITSNPTLPVQPAGSQSAWSVRMVQGQGLTQPVTSCSHLHHTLPRGRRYRMYPRVLSSRRPQKTSSHPRQTPTTTAWRNVPRTAGRPHLLWECSS